MCCVPLSPGTSHYTELLGSGTGGAAALREMLSVKVTATLGAAWPPDFEVGALGP